jgi:hypothetical protein
MFANDLYHDQINILAFGSDRNAIDFMEKAERSDTTNLQSSIVNIQFRLVRVGLKTTPSERIWNAARLSCS